MRTKRLQPGSTLPLGPGATLRSAGLRQRQLHDGIRSEPTAEHAIACTRALTAYLVMSNSTAIARWGLKCQL